MRPVILSYGGGINSTALLLEWVKQGKQLDLVIFADTGSEMPETYEFIDKYVKPFCKKHNLPFETAFYTASNRVAGVKEGRWQENERVSIYDYYDYQKAVPSVRQRSCTDKFKVEPIEKYIKKKWGDKKYPLRLIGIDAGESHRARYIIDPLTGEKEKLYEHNEYPLIDWGWDRNACLARIEEEGWSNPGKSGCFFCPFQKKKSWADLLKNKPDLFDMSMRLESQGKRFPEFQLMQVKPKRLDWFKKAMESQTSLMDFDEDPNIPCACYDG
tara:strand:- start:72 stop:884 length:813 start_codon:yes stop_codon:yes gene_type:complete